LDREIPDDYIQAIKYFASDESKFKSLDEVKSVFELQAKHIDVWNVLVNCNGYYEGEKDYSLTYNNVLWNFHSVAVVKYGYEHYKAFLNWLKPFMIYDRNREVSNYKKMGSYEDEKHILADVESFKVVVGQNYAPNEFPVYKIGSYTFDDLESAVMEYLEYVPKNIGFGFSDEGFCIRYYDDHLLQWTYFELSDYGKSVDGVVERIKKMEHKSLHRVISETF